MGDEKRFSHSTVRRAMAHVAVEVGLRNPRAERGPPAPSTRLIGVNARVALEVALVKVLEEGGTFLLIERLVVGSWQPDIEHVLDGQFDL